MNKEKDQLKLPKSLGKLSFKEQINRQKKSKEKVVETEKEICGELNDYSKSVITTEDMLLPTDGMGKNLLHYYI